MADFFTIKQTPTEANLYLYPMDDVSGATELNAVGANPGENFNAVDENRSVPDTTSYVWTNLASTLTDLYHCQDSSGQSGTINYVAIHSYAKSQTYPPAGNAQYFLLLNIGGSTATNRSATHSLSNEYTTYTSTWTSNVTDSTAWTWAMIDNMQIGLGCNSPLNDAAPATLEMYPTGIADINKVGLPWYRYDSSSQCAPDQDLNWRVMASGHPYGYGGQTYLQNIQDPPVYCAGGESSSASDIYVMSASGTPAGTIDSVQINVDGKNAGQFGTSDDWIQPLLYVASATHYGNKHTYAASESKIVSDQWTSDPTDGSAWTWGKVDNLQAGHWMSHGVEAYYMYASNIHLVVNYLIAVNPEIRTTNIYARVNYVPGTDTATLNKPENYSISHSRETKKLNFWSGDRAVYDLKRNSKTLTMNGSEWDDDVVVALTRLEAIKAMAEVGENITISGMDDYNANTTWLISSFDYTQDVNNPNMYNWSLVGEKA